MLTAKQASYLIEPQCTSSEKLHTHHEGGYTVSTGFQWKRFGKDNRPLPPETVFISRSGKCFITCRTLDGKRVYRKYLPRTVSMYICRKLYLDYCRSRHVKQK